MLAVCLNEKGIVPTTKRRFEKDITEFGLECWVKVNLGLLDGQEFLFRSIG